MFKYKFTAAQAPEDIKNQDDIAAYQRANTFLDEVSVSRVDLFEYSIPKMGINNFDDLFVEKNNNDQIRTIFSQTKEKDNGLANSKISNLLSIQAVVTLLRESNIKNDSYKEVFDLVLCDGYVAARKLLKKIPKSLLTDPAKESDLRLGDNDDPEEIKMYAPLAVRKVEDGLIKNLPFQTDIIKVNGNVVTINMTELKDWKDLVKEMAKSRNVKREVTHASLKFEGLIVVE